jgi:uncharacterized protein (UPF0333 family)
MFKKKGQSTLEYVIVLTAIIAVVLTFAAVFLRQRVQGSLEHVANQMEQKVNEINYH